MVAQQQRGVAAPVEEQQYLLLAGQSRRDVADEVLRQGALHLGGTQIDLLDLGHLGATGAIRQAQVDITPRFDVMQRL